MKTALALLLAAPAAAQFAAPLPPMPKAALAPSLGAAPLETRLPMLASLDLTRLTSVTAPLGDTDYAIALAPMRGVPGKSVVEAQLVGGDAWAVTALPAGANRHMLAGSWPFPALRRQPLSAELGGRDWEVSLVDGLDLAVRFQAKDAPLGGLQVPVTVLKRAAWDAAAPVPAMGPEWRFAFNVDLWVGAGMRSFVFLRRLPDGSVDFYRTGAEAIDHTRALPRKIGPVDVTLQLDSENRLVVRRIVNSR